MSERVLNHQSLGLVKSYNVQEYLDEKRDALARWAQEFACQLKSLGDQTEMW